MYLWWAILATVFIAGFTYAWRRHRREIQEAIVEATKNADGPEAAKALEAHQRGEW